MFSDKKFITELEGKYKTLSFIAKVTTKIQLNI